MNFDPSKPYDALPLLPPSVKIESEAVLKRAISVGTALGELKGILNIIPNPTILLSTIVLQEARLSSLIENVVTTNDKLYRAAATGRGKPPPDPATKEVENYQAALWEGCRQLQGPTALKTDTLVRIVKTVKGKTEGIRTEPLTDIRASGKIIYTPPQKEEVLREKLKNLEEFIHGDDDGLHPLVKMSLIHYQFEAIHPFYDGNGRTGRILNILYLVYKKLLPIPVLYLSRYIIDHKRDYYRLLGNVTEKNDWEPWILFILKGTETTARQTIGMVEKIRTLLEETAQRLESEKKLRKPLARGLANILFEKPYCKVQDLVQAKICSRNTSSKYLKLLTELGILKLCREEKANLYMNTGLLEILRNADSKSKRDSETREQHPRQVKSA